jgi:biopolymer transport protein ExbD
VGPKLGNVGGKPQSDINITPLVDIVLVLLIIFMVITPLLTKSLPIEVPQKAEMEMLEQLPKDQMVLKLFADGHVELNKQTLALEVVGEELETAYRGRRDKVLFFEGEDDAVYGLAVHLMDLAKGAGVETIGMMTKSDETAPDAGLDGAAPDAGESEDAGDGIEEEP